MKKDGDTIRVDKDGDEADMQSDEGDANASSSRDLASSAKKQKKGGVGSEHNAEAVATALATARRLHLAWDKAVREGKLAVGTASSHRNTQDTIVLHDLQEMLTQTGLDEKLLEFERRAVSDPDELSAQYIKDTLNVGDQVDKGIKAIKKKIKAISTLKKS